MMLFKLSWKNIQKSIKDYAIYFFTLILGVAIFYIFNSIESQTVMLNLSASTREIVKLMITMLSGVSVFISFVLGFLIIYASRFLIKRRNKEFSIYMILGMSKGKISKILVIETVLIGVISLFVGLVVGFALSQVMSIFVGKMFDADLTKFSFVFSKSAFIKTIIYFGIMYLFVMIFNTFMVSKCKLIDLLQSAKKSENIKLKNPWLCVIVFIISCSVLGYAYYMVTDGINFLTTKDISILLVPIAMGSVSTFFIFWSISGLILKIVMSIKSLYYKNLNSFTLRQISSKVNTMVFSTTVICLMLFLTICILSSSLAIKEYLNNSLRELIPVDIEIIKEDLNTTKTSLSNEIIKDSKLSILETLDNLEFDWKNKFKNYEEISFYYNSNFTLGDSFGNTLDKMKKKYPYMRYDYPVEVIRVSDYNRLAKMYYLDTYELENDEYMIIANYETSLYGEVLEDNMLIELDGKTYKPKYLEAKNGFIHIAPNASNTGIFLVPDEIYGNKLPDIALLVANYKANDKASRKVIEEELTNLSKHEYANNTNIEMVTKFLLYDASMGLSAIATFIGLYLGIVFLISSAAILALKELSDSSDNRVRFDILRKIGTDEKMINRALFNQIALFFSVPLVLAIIHSIFGIKFCNFLLSSMGISGLLKPIIMTSCILIFIYGGYFILTYMCSKNIIRGRN